MGADIMNALTKVPLYYLNLAPILAALLLPVGCQRAASPTTPRETQTTAPAKVVVGLVRTQLLEKKVNLPATVESDETAMLMPRVDAYVDSVMIDIGDEVATGQVLVRLSAPELEQEVLRHQAMIGQLMADEQVMQAQRASARTQLDVGRAQLDLKRSERQRYAKLVSTGAIERQRLEEADAEVQSTQAMLKKYAQAVQVVEAKLKKGESELAGGQAQLERARTLAGYLEIKAPFAGVVAERNVDPGNLVRSSAEGKDARPLVTLAKVDKLRAVLHATTDLAGQLTVGCPMEFIADDMPEKAFPGQLSRLAGTYNERTRMMRAEMDIDNSVDPLTGRRPLRAGSYGSASILLSATLPVIPASALLGSGSQRSVVVVRDDVCHLTAVKVGFEADEFVGISAGIDSGDQVVVVDPKEIKDGQALPEADRKLEAW